MPDNDQPPISTVEVPLTGEGAWDTKAWCAWCSAEYRVADLGGSGLTLWVNYPNGSMRVCSEGCAIEVRTAVEQGYTRVYEGREAAR